MSFLFGKRKTPQEMMREQQRLVQRSIREIDRERTTLQNNEKKTIIEIKKLAKQGQLPAAKILAKDLVRTRSYITKMYTMRAELQAVSMQLTTMKTTAAMNSAMAGATKAMMRMNAKMNLPAMQKITMEFQKQNEMMGMKEEMINDALDEMAGDDEDEESEDIVNQTLEEIGIDLGTSLADVPSGKVAAKASAQKARPQKVAVGGGAARAAPAPAAQDDDDDDDAGDDDDDLGDLEARLQALKK